MNQDGGRRGISVGGVILNLLTLLILLTTLCVGGSFAAMFLNPGFVGLVNPFLPIKLAIPPTLPPTLGPPTATNTPEIYLPTAWTPTPTSTFTQTLTPTETLVPTETMTPTPAPTEVTPTPSAPFAVQSGSPALTQNFANNKACQWMGVAGQTLSETGGSLKGIAVRLVGQLGGLPIDITSLTGSAPAYGQAGYEIYLSDHPIASNKTLWIQLFDPSSTLPLSEQVYLTTSDKCTENLILVNWVKVR